MKRLLNKGKGALWDGNKKVYEAETLFQSVTTRAEQYKELKGQLEKLKQEFAEIVNNDQFLGKGAEAIKGFYGAQIDVVDAWIRFININIAFFEGIEGTAEEKNVAGETVVKMPFLEEDLSQSNKRAYEMVSQTEGRSSRLFLTTLVISFRLLYFQVNSLKPIWIKQRQKNEDD